MQKVAAYLNEITNITDDMGYNYVGAGYKNLTFSLLYFDYGVYNNFIMEYKSLL